MDQYFAAGFSSLVSATAWILPILLAVTLHEASHGWMAHRFGDDTAKRLGRVTFNPLKHIDPLGTVILPTLLLLIHSPVLFGYAKPVPVDFRYLKPHRLGMFAVAIAGPATNILLAIISALLLHFGGEVMTQIVDVSWWKLSLFYMLLINCMLALFNMLPILPLDGGRVLRALLPGRVGEMYAKTERYGMFIVVLLLLLPAVFGVHEVMNILIYLNQLLMTAILTITGHY